MRTLRAQFRPTQTKTNIRYNLGYDLLGITNGSLVLDIGPEKPKIYILYTKRVNVKESRLLHKSVRLERVIIMGFGNQQWVIPINYIYVICIEVCIIDNWKGPCIDDNDVTDNDSLDQKRNNGFKKYHEIINEYLDDWRNDESEYSDQRIKINIMNKIVNAFQTRSPVPEDDFSFILVKEQINGFMSSRK